MGLIFNIMGKSKEDVISLTNFTIKNYKKKIEEFYDENNYLSLHVIGIEIFGHFNVFDKGKEALEINKLSNWAKVIAHELECYKKTESIFSDVNNIEYDKYDFNKNFVVTYEEEYSNQKGNCKFYAFLRHIDNLENSIKK